MKKLVSVLLICAMAFSLFVACSSDDQGGTSTDATTTKKITTRKVENNVDVPEDKVILATGEAEYKYVVAEVTWTSTDYFTRDNDGFGTFVTENPNWFAKDFDASSWETAIGSLGDRTNGRTEGGSPYGWSGNNHGIFIRTSFTLTQEDIDDIKTEGNALYLDCFYDNTLHLYINGTEVVQHDESTLFQEGVSGQSTGCHDWVEDYDAIFLDSSDERYVYDGDITDLLVVGENVIAASLLDCWGGREFDVGVSIFHSSK